MSLEDLKADLKRNATPVAMQDLDVNARAYLRDTVWPWLESMLEELQEFQLDTEETLAELIEQTEDFLHQATAEAIGKPIGIGFALADALEQRGAASDPKVADLIKQFRESAQPALVTLKEIAVADEESDDDEDEET